MGHYLNKEEQQMYFHDHEGTFNLPEGVDIASFEIIDKWYKKNNRYAKDKNRVYIGEYIIEDADPKTFEIDIDPMNIMYGYRHAKDKNHVYLLGNILEDLSPQNLVFHSQDVVSDGIHVYYLLERLEGADARSFRTFDYDWYGDKSHLWKRSKFISEGDPNTFIVINDRYAKDKNTVYFDFEGTPLEGCNAETIEILDYEYMKDDQHVYLNGQIIADAIPTSFKILDSSKHISKDKDHVFWEFKIVSEADALSFRSIEGRWIDYKHIFVFEGGKNTILPLPTSDVNALDEIKEKLLIFLSKTYEELLNEFMNKYKDNPSLVPLKPALLIPLREKVKEQEVQKRNSFLESHPQLDETLQELYLQEQNTETYFGGFPILLPEERWPTHPKTGNALTFIGQIINDEVSKEFMKNVQLVRIFMDFEEEDDGKNLVALQYTQVLVSTDEIVQLNKPSFEEFKALQATNQEYSIIHPRYTESPKKVTSIPPYYEYLRDFIESQYTILDKPVLHEDQLIVDTFHELHQKQEERKEVLMKLIHKHILEMSPHTMETSFEICILGYPFFLQNEEWEIENSNSEKLPFFLQLPDSAINYGTRQYPSVSHYIYLDPEHPEKGNDIIYQST